MNPNKFCFILCVTNDLYLQECLLYLGNLQIPAGYEVECLQISQATSMAGGYNEGMQATDAKYKIYLHQDTFIINPYFLFSILHIFNHDAKVGMIGMVGTPHMPSDAIMWHADRVGGSIFGSDAFRESSLTGYEQTEVAYTPVEAIDGFLMITQYDIPWQEEWFDGWDFYDISQSYEMRKAGYLVVVPDQIEAWCVHDEKPAKLYDYNKYRNIFIEKYY